MTDFGFGETKRRRDPEMAAMTDGEFSETERDLLERIPGIGEIKSKRLEEKFGDHPRGTLAGVTSASGQTFEDIEGFTLESGFQLQEDLRRYDIDRGIYQADPRERKPRTFGEFSDRVTKVRGTDADPDTTSALTPVETTDISPQDKQRAEKFHSVRSDRAKAIDESLRAPVADSFDQWRDNKNEFDIPGVDLPEGIGDLDVDPGEPDDDILGDLE